MSKSFPHYHQLDAMDCGPTCLRMVAKHYGKHYSLETLRQKSFIGREGVSMLGISTAAESIGFRTIGVHISFEQLVEAPMPCVVHWKQNHFVVVYKIQCTMNNVQCTKGDVPKGTVYVADPGHQYSDGVATYNNVRIADALPTQEQLRERMEMLRREMQESKRLMKKSENNSL